MNEISSNDDKSKISYLGHVLNQLSVHYCGNCIQIMTMYLAFPENDHIKDKVYLLINFLIQTNIVDDPTYNKHINDTFEKIRIFILDKCKQSRISDDEFRTMIKIIYPSVPTINEVIDMVHPLRRYMSSPTRSPNDVTPNNLFIWNKVFFRIDLEEYRQLYDPLLKMVIYKLLGFLNESIIIQYKYRLAQLNIPEEWSNQYEQYLYNIIRRITRHYGLCKYDIISVIIPLWGVMTQDTLNKTIDLLERVYKHSTTSKSNSMASNTSIELCTNMIDTNDNLEKDLKMLEQLHDHTL